MLTYRLTGDASRVKQVINHFSLRIEEERSGSDIDVLIDEDDADDVEEFAESIGVSWEEM